MLTTAYLKIIPLYRGCKLVALLPKASLGQIKRLSLKKPTICKKKVYNNNTYHTQELSLKFMAL